MTTKTINTYNTTLTFKDYANMLHAEKVLRLIDIQLDFLSSTDLSKPHQISNIKDLTIEIKKLTEEDVQSFSKYQEALELINYFDIKRNFGSKIK